MLPEPAAEEVAHIQPVLFMEGTIEMELLPESLLDLRGDPRVELSPGIGDCPVVSVMMKRRLH